METVDAPGTSPRTVAEYEAAIDHYLAEINRIVQRMEADRRETERLGGETRQILDKLQAIVKNW